MAGWYSGSPPAPVQLSPRAVVPLAHLRTVAVRSARALDAACPRGRDEPAVAVIIRNLRGGAGRMQQRADGYGMGSSHYFMAALMAVGAEWVQAIAVWQP